MWFEDFQDGHHGSHHGYQNSMVVAILNLYVASMPPIKFQLNPTYGLRGHVTWRISNWPPWQMPCNNFSLLSWQPAKIGDVHSSKKKTPRGPRATVRSPEWHSHCRHADVMQHFSNLIIATNENIIIWAVLSFEEKYMVLTVDGAWSFE